MTRDIMIIGAGGWGREVAWTLERINAREERWNIIGVADDDPAKASGTLEGYPLLGAVEQASHDHPGAAVVIAIGDIAAREKIYRRLRGHDFPAIVDPAAEIAPTADLRHGVYVGPFAIVSVGCELGKFVIVNTRAGVGHDCRIGDFSELCPGVSLSGHTTVGARVFFGTNASTAPGVTVGDGAKISAGLPVYASLAAGATLSPFGLFRDNRG